MSVIELTPKLVKSASCPIGKQKVDIYDSYCKGLLLEIRITGGKTYSLIYTDSRGKRRQFKLADERDVTLTQVRKLADKLRGEIAMGEDPFAQKTALRNVPKLEDFVANYFVPYIKQYKRGWKTNVSMLNNHILPEFGALFLDEITLSDVIKLHCAMRDKGYAAVTCNNAVIMMRYMFNLAKKWGFKGVENNPSAGFALFEVNNQRERYLSRSEVQLLKNAINESENTQLEVTH